MNLTSTIPDRPYLHLSDSELAQKLAAAELLLEIDRSNDQIEDTCFERNHLIEEILFRYQNSER